MLDQDSAIALLTVADEAGATVALVGDRAQLPAVGRGGVLDMAAALAMGSGGTVFDMDSVHRFTDPTYAALTLRLRVGQDPARLFDQLQALGLVRLHHTIDGAHEHIAAETAAAMAAAGTFAATVATNDEARSLNEQIHAQRVARGEVDDTTTVTGRDGLPIGVGDVIATRKNDSTLSVANRQTWTIQSIGDDGTVWAIEAASARKRQRSVALPGSYVADHAHLAYAATAYGVQGTTTATAHTLLSEALDASGVYVGMTRGRHSNVLHVLADNLDEAREQFIDALQLDRADRGLQAATSAAQAAVAALAAEGPVKVVNDERARLTEVIAHAEREAARWEHAAGLLATQAETHARDEQSGRESLAQAVTPLLSQAAADGQTYLDAHSRQDVAWEATSRWAANTRDGLDAWAKRVAHARAKAEPPVSSARQQVEQTGEVQKQIWWRHRTQVEELTIRVYGRRDAASYRATTGARSAQGCAQLWRQHADAARADLARIESLPLGRAVHSIKTRPAHTHQVQVEQAAAAHRATPACRRNAESSTHTPSLAAACSARPRSADDHARRPAGDPVPARLPIGFWTPWDGGSDRGRRIAGVSRTHRVLR